MADPTGTPGSNADTSMNGSLKTTSAPKDKACPFCHQQFTSSSLGRHLDLYIKEKNPKPPDGIHLVDEIRKLRGGITRRQPRNSLRRRETSTPGGTPGAQDRRSPQPDSDHGDRSPSVRREDIGTSNLMFAGKPRMMLQPPTWEATGVMNNIPPSISADSRSVDGEEREARRIDIRPRSVSKQLLAKSTLEQKQKLTDALDNARAAELALRELLGSITAANRLKLSSSDIFDYDPFTLDFPALCLHCLPPPTTLHASTQVPNASSWNIAPPSDVQYEAVREHFTSAFRNHRNNLAISSTAPVDDLSYPPPPENYSFPPRDLASQAAQAISESNELEMKVNTHIHDTFAAWVSIPASRRSEIWVLELARSVGRKSMEIDKLRKEKDYSNQSIAHLQQQIDDLSRLQQPREFRIAPPMTFPISQEMINVFGRGAAAVDKWPSVGFSILDRSEQIDTIVERAVGRWKTAVREARGGSKGGMKDQRNLNGDSLLPPSGAMGHVLLADQALQSSTRASVGGDTAKGISTMSPSNNISSLQASNGLESLNGDDVDADADADMEEDESFSELRDLDNVTAQNGQAARYQLSNGLGKAVGDGMEGIISESRGRGSGFSGIAS